MKFKIKSSFIIGLVLIVISLSLVATVEEKSSRAESMMEYLNTFFSASRAGSENVVENSSENESENAPHKDHKKKHHKKHHAAHHDKKAHFRFKENTEYSKKINKTGGKKNKTKKAGNKGHKGKGGKGKNKTLGGAAGNSTNSTTPENTNNSSPYLQDWLMISSPAFKNPVKFPEVILTNGTKLTINVDSEFFRINKAFNSQDNSDKGPTNKFFWFRLSGLNIYYSLTTTDINILGAIHVKKITGVSLNPGIMTGTNMTYCFTVQGPEGNNWKICAVDEPTQMKWVNALRKVLGLKELGEQKTNTTIVERNITQPIIIIPLPSRECNDGWNYQQNGEDWECDCSEGHEQSPIDLPEISKAIDSPVKPLFQYEEVNVMSKETTIDGMASSGKPMKLQLMDNTLKMFHRKFGKVVTMDGAIYYAQEIVVHTPSEHTIEGKKFDLEVQIIHYGQSKGDIAKQLVLSFVFEKTPGVYNKFIDDLDIFNLPNPITKERELTTNIFLPKILFSADDSDTPTMRPFSFYTYQGSLTMPPCTEQTIMYVASKPIPLGSTAIQLFQEALRVPDLMNNKGDVIVSNWIPQSNRSTQPVNGRPVFHYDHEKNCGPDPKKPKEKPRGHYEKVLKAATNYFYVNSEDPSGIPNAFVVSEQEATGIDPKKKKEEMKGASDKKQ